MLSRVCLRVVCAASVLGLAPLHGRGSCVVTAPAVLGSCAATPAFHARGAVISPDGGRLYAFGGFDDASTVSVFALSVRTGLLAPAPGRAACATYVPRRRCLSTLTVNKPTAAAISPDGKDLFLTAWCCSKSAFEAVHLDPTTGALAVPFCCSISPRAVARGDDVAVSPDGRNVYVASAEGTGHGLAILTRDPVSGAVVQPAGADGCVQRIGANGCAAAPSTSFAPSRVVVSADGGFVLVVSNGDVFSFVRKGGTGALTAGTCVASKPEPPCVALEPTGDNVLAVAVTPDGRSVYALASHAGIRTDVLLTFGVSAGGTLTESSNTSTLGHPYVERVWGPGSPLATAPDGSAVYLARSTGVVVFRRLGDGTLRQAQTLKVPTTEDGTVASVEPSPDGRFVYVSEEGDLRGADAVLAYIVRL